MGMRVAQGWSFVADGDAVVFEAIHEGLHEGFSLEQFVPSEYGRSVVTIHGVHP